MTPSLRAWLALAAGMMAGFALLAAVFETGPSMSDALLLAAIACSSSGVLLASSRRRGCKDHSANR